MKKMFHANGNEKKAGVAILVRQVDFKTKTEIKGKEEHYIIIKVSIHEKDTTFSNIYAPNTGAPKYIKQILTDLKGETDNTIMAGNFNTPATDISFR